MCWPELWQCQYSHSLSVACPGDLIQVGGGAVHCHTVFNYFSHILSPVVQNHDKGSLALLSAITPPADIRQFLLDSRHFSLHLTLALHHNSIHTIIPLRDKEAPGGLMRWLSACFKSLMTWVWSSQPTLEWKGRTDSKKLSSSFCTYVSSYTHIHAHAS